MIPINPKRNVLDRRLPKAFSIDKHSRLPRGTNHEMKRFLFSADARISTLIDAKPPYKKFANKTCKEGESKYEFQHTEESALGPWSAWGSPTTTTWGLPPLYSFPSPEEAIKVYYPKILNIL